MIFTPLLTVAMAIAVPNDERVDWLVENAVAIRTVDPDADDDSDLAPLLKKLEGVRVLLLGEPSHGDGTAFLLKRRLIRYLHREAGFDVIAWESGIYDVEVMQEMFRGDGATDEAATYGVYAIWNGSSQARPIFDFTRSTLKSDAPIENVGFDCKTSARGSELFAARTLALVDRSPEPLLSKEQRAAFLRATKRIFEPPFFAVGSLLDKDRASFTEMEQLFKGDDSPLRELVSEQERQLRARMLASWRTQLELRTLLQKRETLLDEYNGHQKGMAENLLFWTKEQYPERKIIVWLANQHLLRDLPSIDTELDEFSFEHYTSLAEELEGNFADGELLSVAVTANQGDVGIPVEMPTKLTPAAEGSLEALCHATKIPTLYLDLRSVDGPAAWLNEPLLGRPIGYQPVRARWPHHVDAFLFIDDMRPSTFRDK